MISIVSLLVNYFKIYVLKSTKITIFPHSFFNVDISFNIENRLLKLSVVTIDMLMEGTVSHLGPSSCFMLLKKLCFQIL